MLALLILYDPKLWLNLCCGDDGGGCRCCSIFSK